MGGDRVNAKTYPALQNHGNYRDLCVAGSREFKEPVRKQDEPPRREEEISDLRLREFRRNWLSIAVATRWALQPEASEKDQLRVLDETMADLELAECCSGPGKQLLTSGSLRVVASERTGSTTALERAIANLPPTGYCRNPPGVVENQPRFRNETTADLLLGERCSGIHGGSERKHLLTSGSPSLAGGEQLWENRELERQDEAIANAQLPDLFSNLYANPSPLLRDVTDTYPISHYSSLVNPSPPPTSLTDPQCAPQPFGQHSLYLLIIPVGVLHTGHAGSAYPNQPGYGLLSLNARSATANANGLTSASGLLVRGPFLVHDIYGLDAILAFAHTLCRSLSLSKVSSREGCFYYGAKCLKMDPPVEQQSRCNRSELSQELPRHDE
ncbi:hypothetical protein C7212DRAFT_341946 [Tuber magnatum]|uniref:Uncharacterized protein n=1 Tax=Tuber magnatum TaxID=42249 RepID=A0A317T0M7_9PEZI|nr:hypothetical protein C7212DRAFT_341946 [Tuber magnatum]